MVPQKTVAVKNTAQAYLELLGTMGVKYLFGNAGDTFVSIIDAFAKRRSEEKNSPRPMQIVQENCLMNMAYGYYLTTGEPPVVMVHAVPGTAAALSALLNATHSQAGCK